MSGALLASPKVPRRVRLAESVAGWTFLGDPLRIFSTRAGIAARSGFGTADAAADSACAASRAASGWAIWTRERRASIDSRPRILERTVMRARLTGGGASTSRFATAGTALGPKALN